MATGEWSDRMSSLCAGWNHRHSPAIAVGWVAAFVLGLAILDVPVAAWVHRNVPVDRLMGVFRLMKAPGHFGLTLVVAAALVAWHPGRWRAAALLCLSGMLAGLLCALAKWGVGRTRPFKGVPPFELHPFAHGLHGLTGAENQSFPSGHTCLAFAAAAALSVLLPRWRAGFTAVAMVVGVERIVQGSHYVADVVAAAGIGILSAQLVRRALERAWRTGAAFAVGSTVPLPGNAAPPDSPTAAN